MTIEDLNRYKAGGLAGLLAQSKEGQMYLGGALEQLASDMGIEEDADGFIQGVLTSDNAIRTAVGVYSKKYQKALESLTINELKNSWYSEILKDYLNESESTKIKNELGKFGGENLGEINKEIEGANLILLGEKKSGEKIYKFSDEEKNNAKESIKKYEKIMLILNTLENDKLESLRSNAVKRTGKKTLKEIAGGL